MRQQKGFTLDKLLLVIAIIAILASLAILLYLSYQRKQQHLLYKRKADVASYAEPIARACMLDLMAYCLENPGARVAEANLTGSNSPATNCRGSDNTNQFSTAGGTVTLYGRGTLTCNNDGSASGATIIATLSGVDDFKAECTVDAGSIRCTIVKLQ